MERKDFVPFVHDVDAFRRKRRAEKFWEGRPDVPGRGTVNQRRADEVGYHYAINQNAGVRAPVGKVRTKSKTWPKHAGR